MGKHCTLLDEPVAISVPQTQTTFAMASETAHPSSTTLQHSITSLVSGLQVMEANMMAMRRAMLEAGLNVPTLEGVLPTVGEREGSPSPQLVWDHAGADLYAGMEWL